MRKRRNRPVSFRELLDAKIESVRLQVGGDISGVRSEVRAVRDSGQRVAFDVMGLKGEVEELKNVIAKLRAEKTLPVVGAQSSVICLDEFAEIPQKTWDGIKPKHPWPTGRVETMKENDET